MTICEPKGPSTFPVNLGEQKWNKGCACEFNGGASGQSFCVARTISICFECILATVYSSDTPCGCHGTIGIVLLLKPDSTSTRPPSTTAVPILLAKKLRTKNI